MNTQLRKSLIATAVAVSLAGGVGSASAAQSYSFDFGTLIAGSYQPGGTFANLSVNSADDMTFTFALTTYDLNSLFTSGAFIGRAIFNTLSDASPISQVIAPGSWGVTSIDAANGSGGSLQLDFGTSFGQGAGNRLTGNEAVQWTVTFGSVQTTLFGDPAASLHVQGLTTGQGGSAWYTPTTPVPEPETYAMLLAGLGLVGAMARRRRIQ